MFVWNKFVYFYASASGSTDTKLLFLRPLWKFTIPSANKVGTKKYGYHYDTGNEAGAYG